MSRSTAVMAVILLAAVAARAAFLSDGLWYDEIAAFLGYSFNGPWHAASTYFSTANHVLHSVLVAMSAGALGADELSLRLPSFLAGIGAVAAIAWLAREACVAGLVPWAAGAAALMPVAVLPATESRGYSMMMLFAALATAAFLRARRAGGAWWLAYALAAALGTWSHLVTICVPAFHGLWCVVAAARAAGPDDRRRALAGAGAALLAGLLSAAFLAPVIPGIVALRDDFRALDGNEPSLLGPEGAGMLWSIGGTWWAWPSLVAMPLAVAGLRRAQQDRAYRQALVLSLGGVLVALAFPILLKSWLYARFLAFAVPGIALLLGGGAQAIAARHRAAAAAACVVAVAAWLACLATLGPRQQLREATDLLASAMKPGERAVAVGLPDDVHRWYALARGIDLPGCGAYGRDMLPAVEDRSVHWVMSSTRAPCPRRSRHCVRAASRNARGCPAGSTGAAARSCSWSAV
ncbi:MAG: hypothetical protein ACKOF7_01940, partial [Phycisphaerales bacterium]